MLKIPSFVLVYLVVACFSTAQAQTTSEEQSSIDEIDFSQEDPAALKQTEQESQISTEQPAAVENLFDEPTPANPRSVEKFDAKKESGEIVVEQKEDAGAPYRRRRGSFGSVFAINFEKFYPKDYYSLIQEKYYDEVLGSTAIPVFGAEFGIKYNFVMGSITALVGYASGSVDDTSKGVETMKIAISKAAINFSLDALMDEPWVVPYGQVGAHQFSWTEISLNALSEREEENTLSNWNLSYKAGVMFQLNWLEKSIDASTHEQGMRSSGLENTFLDVFYSVYSRPQNVAEGEESGEPDLASAQIGVGLKLEF